MRVGKWENPDLDELFLPFLAAIFFIGAVGLTFWLSHPILSPIAVLLGLVGVGCAPGLSSDG